MKEMEIIDEPVAALTLSEGRELFIGTFIRPFFISDAFLIHDSMNYRSLAERLSGKVVKSLFDEVVETTQSRISKKNQRSEVKVYMVDKKAKELLGKAGQVLIDLARLRENILLPETEEEMVSLVAIISRALKTGEPITFFTPFCPDWSRDSQGKYDFKSLGGGESFIANKFLVNAPEFLEVFQRNGVPFCGILLFADWGLETEIDARGTYGKKLTPDDVQMCFASTLSTTDQTLGVLQADSHFGKLFANYCVVSMSEFLLKRVNEQQIMAGMRHFFTTDKQGLRLIEVLSRDSLKINKQRLGITSEVENCDLALRNAVEYSTLGQAIGDHSFLVVCESRTTSRCYNLPRERDKKAPTFFVKGKEGLSSGVNIL